MLINLLLSKNLPFVVYRLPGESRPVFVVQLNAEVQEFFIEDLDKQQGFVIAPFEAYKTGKAYLLDSQVIAKSTKEQHSLENLLRDYPDQEPQFGEPENPIVSKKTYLQQANYLIDRMKAGDLQKVVLSRVHEHQLGPSFNYSAFFNRFMAQYPAAFVYLFFLPGKGLWAGATPETLIEKKGDVYETMALAGTQKVNVPDKEIIWEEKEIQEQGFVTEFIETQLQDLKINDYHKSVPGTIMAGKLAHIRTRFQVPEKLLSAKIGKLVKTLHPTPAVCGLPKEKAWKLIEEVEHHQREFYTGFLGPWNIEEVQHLFVNLRCGRFFKDRLALYVGGGLTAQSEAEKEWKETSDKSTTLLSVVENLRNFAP